MTAADRARASRAEQGLPATVEDPAALSSVATLLATAAPARGGEAA